MTEVTPCGTLVTSKLSNVNGIVTAISIRFDTVNYEVSYFSGHEYKTIWMNGCEFTTTTDKEQIGFKKN